MKVIEQIKQWHYDRNLIHGSTDKDQFYKLIEEMLELQKSTMKGEPVIDDIGDIIVVLINIAERNGLTIEQCLEHAYNDIKDRKGQMINGIFVKDE